MMTLFSSGRRGRRSCSREVRSAGCGFPPAEANGEEVAVALGYSATPDVPKLAIPVSEIRAGTFELRR